MKKYNVTQEQILDLFDQGKHLDTQLSKKNTKATHRWLQDTYNGLSMAINILGLSEQFDDYLDNQQTPKK
jgi:hypothetical protein